MTLTRQQQIEAIEKDWAENPRWKHVKRTYSAEEVINLRGSFAPPANTIAQRGADKLWELVNGSAKKGYVNCLGALTGGQAVQQAKAGIEAIYLSGWQVAADNNTASTMYPDQSLYPVDSVPAVVSRINNAFRRADQIQWSNGSNPEDGIDYFLPIVADAEAGFGGVLNAYELMRNMIDAGAAGVHFEDQLASVKKCGHMGGKVLVPTQEAVQKLVAARLAADVAGTTTLVIARTDANAADLLTSDCDPYDKDFIEGERSAEGFYRVRAGGIDQAIARGLAYAPYADLIWCETAKPCLEEARKFAEAIHEQYRISCWPTTVRHHSTGRRTWMLKPSLSSSRSWQIWGYKYQFITLAGIHNMWFNMFELAHSYAQGEGMRHYVEKVQRPEFEAADKGYTFVAHQQEVGTGYFDKMTNTIQGGQSSVTALTGSTEEEQF